MIRWLVPVLLLSACVAGPAQDRIARAAAREAVSKVAAERLRGVPVMPVTDCLIENATAAEIARVAADSAEGRPGPVTVQTVAEIMGRPGTLDCLGARALPMLAS